MNSLLKLYLTCFILRLSLVLTLNDAFYFDLHELYPFSRLNKWVLCLRECKFITMLINKEGMRKKDDTWKISMRKLLTFWKLRLTLSRSNMMVIVKIRIRHIAHDSFSFHSRWFETFCSRVFKLFLKPMSMLFLLKLIRLNLEPSCILSNINLQNYEVTILINLIVNSTNLSK